MNKSIKQDKNFNKFKNWHKEKYKGLTTVLPNVIKNNKNPKQFLINPSNQNKKKHYTIDYSTFISKFYIIINKFIKIM